MAGGKGPLFIDLNKREWLALVVCVESGGSGLVDVIA
jgi:hypothetical protein